jgi:predicted MFS family arabinose efflux permease
MPPRASGYNSQIVFVLVLALTIGSMSFDQCSVGFLLSFMRRDFDVSPSQIGQVASLYWVTFSIGSYLAGTIASRAHSLKRLLSIMTVAFGLCSALSAAASSPGSLAIVRGVAGLAGGALLTLIQAYLSVASQPEKMGVNMGLVTGFGGSFFGQVFAPIVLVALASSIGWRMGFALIFALAFLASALVAGVLIEPPRPRMEDAPREHYPEKPAKFNAVEEILRGKNVLICVIMCALYVSYLGIGLTFIPSFLVEVRHLSGEDMSYLMAVLGASSIVFTIILPPISNKLGRKPVLIAASLASILAPLAVCFYQGSSLVLAVFMFVGWTFTGSGPFCMGIVPSESVGSDRLTRVLGLIISLGVLAGGLLGPSLAGWGAEQWGPLAPLLILAGCAAFAALMACALQETGSRPLRSVADII